MRNESESYAALKWGTFVVLLLGSQVAIGVAAIVLAGSDPSVAVVPGYHQKAILWDESVQLRQASLELGWTVELKMSPEDKGNLLTWTIRDRDGDTIDSLKGRVVMFHHARANESVEFRVEEHPSGVMLDRDGLWQIEMTLDTQQMDRRFFYSTVVVSRRAV